MTNSKKGTAAAVNAAETESIYLPLIPGGEKSEWIARNGRSWTVPRGRTIEVPKVVADILREKESNELEGMRYAAEEAAKASHAVTSAGNTIAL